MRSNVESISVFHLIHFLFVSQGGEQRKRGQNGKSGNRSLQFAMFLNLCGHGRIKYVDTCTPVSVKNSKKATHVVVKDVAVMSTS